MPFNVQQPHVIEMQVVGMLSAMAGESESRWSVTVWVDGPKRAAAMPAAAGKNKLEFSS